MARTSATGNRSARTVTHVWIHKDDLASLVLDDETLTTTEDHPFWNASDNEWQRADALERGDSVRSVDGRLVRVMRFERAGRHRATAYNLAVQGVHTFHVGTTGTLVHNMCPKLQPQKLSADEQAALAAKRAGKPHDPALAKSAEQKQIFNEKAAGQRNKQKRGR